MFGDYLSRVVNLGEYSSATWAALIVIVLTYVNYRGIQEGKVTQNIFTVLEVSGLVLIIVFIQKRPQGLFALKGRSAEA